MTDNAKNIPCKVQYRPTSHRYSEAIRQFQGCPTIALTRKGRIYVGWYSGGTREPHMENYNLLVYSDDKGESWSEPLIVIESNKELFVHALDIQLWTDPDGRLHVYWVQNNTAPASDVPPVCSDTQPLMMVDGYMFSDFTHACWEIICDDPDAEEPVFSEPRYLDKGFLRCKPLVTESGKWLCFNYDQVDPRYGYSISCDNGQSYEHRYGSEKLATCFDEAMAYTTREGSIRMLARTRLGELAECYSYDEGNSFTDAKASGIDSPNTRFYVARTPSGRLLLVNNDDRKVRKNMTVYLSSESDDELIHRVLIDPREHVSYPDADFFDGRIYLVYDRERTGAMEILFLSFTEQDVIDGTLPAPRIISKPKRV